MSDFDKLYHHPDIGYIIRWRESARIQLAYSIIKISFHPDEFSNFFKCLSYQLKKHSSGMVDETLKMITIPTPDPGLDIVLSLKELKELLQMIADAICEMEVLSMLAQFKVNNN